MCVKVREMKRKMAKGGGEEERGGKEKGIGDTSFKNNGTNSSARHNHHH